MIYTKNYPAPEVNVKEALRYAGGGDVALIYECIKEADEKFSYKVCYAIVDIVLCGDSVDLGFASTVSKNLAKNLAGCTKAVVFAATVGTEIDRLIGKYNLLSPSKAVCLQALGSERVESLCDSFEDSIKEEISETNGEMHFRPRFSPGYGDLSLEFQKEIFRLLDCPRRIGVSLGESLLMSPSKSVTAIIGFGEEK